ncbi:MAG: SDR family NAD(P)-dependent oxidoreductase, partial [Cyanobacteria bacterium P01_H01_bin.21]
MYQSDAIDHLDEIAIIGMAGRFPGAKTIDQFWQNLKDGVESIVSFTEDELIASGHDPSALRHSSYVKAGAVLEEVDCFDANFFGFSPKEAEITDPQHRLFLECAWEALEDAAYNPTSYSGKVGIFAGATLSNYLLFNLLSQQNQITGDPTEIFIGNENDHLPARVSYKLNLKGPSVNVQTACSTSLVSVHFACQSLLSGEADMALAGGVTVRLPQKSGYLYQEKGILSPDGHCRAFDAKAQGTVFGNGVGIVVLKRLDDAIASQDHIYAVIKGSAINNDGAMKVGYTAPSLNAQASVIAEALEVSGVQADSVQYVEAHGTGTALGDPIEVTALTQAFRKSTTKQGYCRLGSVKTNVGHLNAAAGITGLIKTVLSLQHKIIPPTLNFETPNPDIDFVNSPFRVNTELTQWQRNGTPRRAGVSSFGMGGTNAHVVLEEAPSYISTTSSRPWQLLTVSAKTSSALNSSTTKLAHYLNLYPEQNLADVAYTLQTGRKVFEHRRIAVCQSIEDVTQVLSSEASPRLLTRQASQAAQAIIFMFPGQGSQYPNMAKEIYQTEAEFRFHVDRCSEILHPILGFDLREHIYPTTDADHQQLQQTEIAQIAIFVVEYALAKLWMSWGIWPEAMIGHSIGEYVAACLSGVLSLEDALKVIAARGKLMQQTSPGAMVSVHLPVAEIEPLLNPALALAAVNSPTLSVISGSPEAIAQLEQQLTLLGVKHRRLHTSHGFHSAMMEPILDDFRLCLGKVAFNPPEIPYISNVTGTWVTASEVLNPEYWVTHLRQTVQFQSGIQELLQQPNLIFLEVGAGRTLSTLLRQQSQALSHLTILSSVRHPRDQQSDVAHLLNTLGQLWLVGVSVDWAGFYAHEQRQRTPLPPYPFERQRYWVDPNLATGAKPSNERQTLDDWFYVPTWKRTQLPSPSAAEISASLLQNWLIFADSNEVDSHFLQHLRAMSQNVTVVRVGEGFCQTDETSYTINPDRADDYDALIETLVDQDKIPSKIAHFWTTTPAGLEEAEKKGFYSLLFLAQALGKHMDRSVQLIVISSQLHDVTGEAVHPEAALVTGPCRVISKEYSNFSCRSIDLPFPATAALIKDFSQHLIAEFSLTNADEMVAYRGHHRWLQDFESVHLKTTSDLPLRQNGVYLITGGLGSIALALAEYLARTFQAKLVLVSRSPFPNQTTWTDWTDWTVEKKQSDDIGQKISLLQSLIQLGAEIEIIQADVTNLAQMQTAISQAQEKFGALHGVIHAAGIAGGGIIQLKAAEQAARVLSPKVNGTQVLETALLNLDIDFLVLFSSLNSIVGLPGQVDYCAANAFLDAIAMRRNAKKQRTLVINWDTWADIGMAIKTQLPDSLKRQRDQQLSYGIKSVEGIQAFQLALASGLPQVLVSTRPLDALRSQDLGLKESAATESAPTVGTSYYSRPQLSNAYVAPRNTVETVLIQFWQDLLKIEPIGIYDNFFEIGGHSLLATQLLSQIRDHFGVKLPLGSLFETSTVSALADFINQAAAPAEDNRAAEELLPKVTPDPSKLNAPFPLTDIQQAYWIGRDTAFELGNVATHNYSEIESTQFDLKRFNQAWQRLVERHDMLHAVVLPSGEQQILEQVPPYQIDCIDLRGQAPDKVSAQLKSLREELSHQVLPAGRYPLFDIRAVALDHGRFRLFFSIDLLIADIWSFQILIFELTQLYTQPEQVLPPLELSFRDYVLGTEALKQTELYQRSKAYWQQRLPTLPPAPALPLRCDPAQLDKSQFQRRTAQLEAPLWQALKQRASQAGLTPSGVLLAAYAEVLQLWNQTPQFTLNLTLFNRLPLHPQVQQLVGDFTSVTLLAVDGAGANTFEQRAQRLQTQLWEDLDHRHYSGIEVLRDMGRLRGDAPKATMPVVFTSALTNPQIEQATTNSLSWLGELVYGVSQTPQVWLDHQVYEEDGNLAFFWDAIEDLFCPGVLDDMFTTYCTLLQQLATPDTNLWQANTWVTVIPP